MCKIKHTLIFVYKILYILYKISYLAQFTRNIMMLNLNVYNVFILFLRLFEKQLRQAYYA